MDTVKVSPVRQRSTSTIPLNKMHTTTADFFRWDVVHCLPMVAKDVVSFSCQSFVQSAPNPFPINGSASYGMYAFFVPNRIVWKDWKFYIENLQEGLTPPYFTLGDLVDAFHSANNPWKDDYFDQAVKYISNIDNLSAITKFLYSFESSTEMTNDWRDLKLSAMPLRMANRIWFDWMRDKVHISDSALGSYCLDTGGHISLGELIQLCAPRYRCYPKNFFTSSFDTPQEGLSTTAGVTGGDGGYNIQNSPSGSTGSADLTIGSSREGIQTDGDVLSPGQYSNGDSGFAGVQINDIRYASAIQQYAERLLVAGKTVLSRALALFGTSPTIEELQMSAYLGGHEEELQFQTHMSPSSTIARPSGQFNYFPFGNDPTIATMAGQKFQDIVSNGDGCGLKNITYSTDESGYLFVFGAITPHVQYFQGLPRNWTRGLDTFNHDRFDYFHSDLENQPMMPVLFHEVACDPDLDPRRVFAFNLMYSDYKMSYDSLGGDFMNPRANTLMQSMHLGRDIVALVKQLAQDAGSDQPNEFLTPAVLTQATGRDVEEFDSKFTVTDATLDHFIVNHKISVTAVRPMQLYSLPSLDASLSASTGKDLIDTGGMRL